METQLERIVRKTESGELKGGILRISFNGFSANQLFENQKRL